MENKKSTWITGILLVGIVFFLLHHIVSISFIGAIHHISSCILYPVLRLQKVFIEPIKHWSEQRSTAQELRTIIDGLQVERDSLLAENIKLQSGLLHSVHFPSKIGTCSDIMIHHPMGDTYIYSWGYPDYNIYTFCCLFTNSITVSA